MNLTVFLASNIGTDPKLPEMMKQFGRWIGEHGHTLVYGGANDGLMTILADSVLENGGKVIGVMPAFLAARGRMHTGLSEFYLCESMEERKKKLLELGDVYIAMPGGPGTLEEIAQAISAVRLGILEGKCIFASFKGYYEPLKKQFDAMTEYEFVQKEELTSVFFADTLAQLESMIE